jgi:TIR domain
VDRPRVFISYRREEAAGHAGRLRDSLCARFGDDHVFMDLEMAPGIDFMDELSVELGRCDVLLVLIGREWIRLHDSRGRPRLEDPDDFVRREIETALARPDVVVVPILVQGASMPGVDQLPETMRSLARRNALDLSDNRWSFDVDRLASHLQGRTPDPRPPVAAWGVQRAATAFVAGSAVAWLPSWGVHRAFAGLVPYNSTHPFSREVRFIVLTGPLQRGVPWALFAALVAAWAAHTARATRPLHAATGAFIVAIVAAGVGSAFTQAMRVGVKSVDIPAAEIIGYVILGGGLTFAAVRASAPQARRGAFVFGLMAGALCGGLRNHFGPNPHLGEAAEFALQGLAIGSAAFIAVVLSGSRRQINPPPAAVRSLPPLTGA